MRLSNRASFVLLISIVVAFLAGSIAPTPLYGVYQAAWGFSPITIAVVFGIYAIAVLAALLSLGSLSDYVGRRPVLFFATAAQAVTMLLFAHAGSVRDLIVARVLQGIATGAAISAVGAGMLDLDRQKGALANAVGPQTGTGLGAVASGLMVQYLPLPTQLVYYVLFAIFVVQAWLVTRMPESSVPKPGALASLRPRFGLPREVRAQALLAMPVLIATWALIGFYGSLGPTLVKRLAGSGSQLLGGLAVFALAGTGAVTVLSLNARSARSLMTFGTLSLALGVALTLFAIAVRSVAGFFLATGIAGMGFGAGFQGALRSVMLIAPAEERAGVLSVLYVVAYLALGVPAVIGALGVVYGGGLWVTTHEYGLAVIALAVLALVGQLARARSAPERKRASVRSLPSTSITS